MGVCDPERVRDRCMLGGVNDEALQVREHGIEDLCPSVLCGFQAAVHRRRCMPGASIAIIRTARARQPILASRITIRSAAAFSSRVENTILHPGRLSTTTENRRP